MKTFRLMALLHGVYAAMLGWEAWRVGVTFDEPSHLTRAYTYWLGQDVLFPPDTTPLPWIVNGWAPRLLGLPLRRDTEGWKHQSSFEIGQEILEALDARSKRRIIFWTRLTILIFPLLTVWLVWHWGRQIFTETTALLLAVCAALEPTLMGHGALLKSDVAAAFGCLLFF